MTPNWLEEVVGALYIIAAVLELLYVVAGKDVLLKAFGFFLLFVFIAKGIELIYFDNLHNKDLGGLPFLLLLLWVVIWMISRALNRYYPKGGKP